MSDATPLDQATAMIEKAWAALSALWKLSRSAAPATTRSCARLCTSARRWSSPTTPLPFTKTARMP
jgi:hypothetical protein